MNITPKEIEDYCKEFSLQDTELLSQLTTKTWETEEMPQMLSGWRTVRWLEDCCKF